jgi:hypothetical protein
LSGNIPAKVIAESKKLKLRVQDVFRDCTKIKGGPLGDDNYNNGDNDGDKDDSNNNDLFSSN